MTESEGWALFCAILLTLVALLMMKVLDQIGYISIRDEIIRMQGDRIKRLRRRLKKAEVGDGERDHPER